MIAVALSIGFVAGYQFRSLQDDAELAQAQSAQMEAADLASRKEAERLAAEAARADLSVQLEDAANAQEPAASCLPVSRVLRLNRR
jgi:hypothetical protein